MLTITVRCLSDLHRYQTSTFNVEAIMKLSTRSFAADDYWIRMRMLTSSVAIPDSKPFWHTKQMETGLVLVRRNTLRQNAVGDVGNLDG